MNKTQWAVAETIASGLGVNPPAIMQWRVRNTVPHKWRLRLIVARPDMFSIGLFDALDKANRRRQFAPKKTNGARHAH